MQRYKLSVTTSGEPEIGLNAAVPTQGIANMLRAVSPDDGKEHLTVLALDTRGDVLGYEEIASGTVDACMLYPRDIFAWALQVPMVRFVAIAHNHPSGKVDLSQQDKVGSAVVAKVGALVGLDLAWSMVYTHRGPQWEVWQPEGAPQAGNEDAQPQQPRMPEGMERPEDEGEDELEAGQPEPGEDDDGGPGDQEPEQDEGEGEDTPDEPGESEDGPEGDAPAPEEQPRQGKVNVTPEVDLDAVRAALRRVIGK